jgi:hypothetical protein
MTNPEPQPKTPVEMVRAMEQALRELTQRVAIVELDIIAAGAPPLPPAPPPPPPQRWADRAGPDDWFNLVDWVDNLIADYSLRGSEYLPPCWPAHPGVVEELAGLWHAWIEAVLADRAAGADGSGTLTMWHTYWLAPCLARLQGNIYYITNCRTNKAHWAPSIAPTLTDRTFIPALPGP